MIKSLPLEYLDNIKTANANYNKHYLLLQLISFSLTMSEALYNKNTFNALLRINLKLLVYVCISFHNRL